MVFFSTRNSKEVIEIAFFHFFLPLTEIIFTEADS